MLYINNTNYLNEGRTTLIPTYKGKGLKPVFIILSGANDMNLRKKIQLMVDKKGIYTHAMVSMSSNLHYMYTYNNAIDRLNTSSGFTKGGFVIEDIDRFKDIFYVKVMCIFVSAKQQELLKKNLKSFIDNQEKTKYSFKIMFSIPFKINFEQPWQMICSQFVDYILKLSDTDLSTKTSSKMTPNNFDDLAVKNPNIYTLCTCNVRDYKPELVDKMVQKIKNDL
jgi:hypothetical protein